MANEEVDKFYFVGVRGADDYYWDPANKSYQNKEGKRKKKIAESAIFCCMC